MIEKNKHFLNIVFRVILTSVGAVLEILAISLIFNLTVELNFLISVISLILIIYSWDFYQEYSYQIGKKQANLIIVFLLITIGLFFLSLSLSSSIAVSVTFLLLFFMGLFYNVYFKKLSSKIIGFKDFFVTACWSTLILLFFLYTNKTDVKPMMFFLAFVFTRDFTNIVFCDLKDESADKKKKIQTVAGLLGTAKTIRLLLLVGFLSGIIILSGVLLNVLPEISYFLLIPVFLTSLFILNSHRIKHFSPSVVDFEYFNWFVFAVIGKLIL